MAFAQYIETVGGELEKAQRLLADHHAGFGQWVRDEFGWTHRQAQYLISAAGVMRLLGTVVPSKNLPLPATESQCRPLASLPAEDVIRVWEKACESAGAYGKQPTNALVIEAKYEVLPDTKPIENPPQPVHEEMADAIKNAVTKFAGRLTTPEQFAYVRSRIEQIMQFLSEMEAERGSGGSRKKTTAERAG
jgi:hypothetical protein